MITYVLLKSQGLQRPQRSVPKLGERGRGERSKARHRVVPLDGGDPAIVSVCDVEKGLLVGVCVCVTDTVSQQKKEECFGVSVSACNIISRR